MAKVAITGAGSIKYVADKYEGQDILAGQPTELPRRSVEYGSYIIEAVETGKTFKLNGNIINRGMITNLPADCCAAGPLYVDRTGIHQTIVGDLPSQCAALNMTNINVQRLAVEAEAEWLPQFAGRKPRPTPKISTPKGTAHAHVPVDPALAIAARFGELAQ